ncbi:MAG: sigma-70 family RNA polymerase sigma factor [Ruminococcaceae bacterium]|nr:sigma-70 family RNA polymerase sigma factor [Oscillospiraceae bacterium]
MVQYASYPFENCDDATLITLIKGDCDTKDQAFEMMCARYLNLISSIASKYRYCDKGYELSDFMQEGLIGLLSACKTFDENAGMSFKNYAMLCVENRFRSIYRHAVNKAQVPLSNIVPIDESVSTLEDNNAISMQELIESKDYIKTVYKKIEGTLSELEKKVLSLYLSGYSYKQSATALNVSEKAIDNALYRIRKKLS